MACMSRVDHSGVTGIIADSLTIRRGKNRAQDGAQGFMTPIVLLGTKTIARQITSISRQKLAVLRIVCSIFGMLAVLRPAANARSATAISSGGGDDRLWAWGDRRVVRTTKTFPILNLLVNPLFNRACTRCTYGI